MGGFFCPRNERNPPKIKRRRTGCRTQVGPQRSLKFLSTGTIGGTIQTSELCRTAFSFAPLARFSSMPAVFNCAPTLVLLAGPVVWFATPDPPV
jgi:hypothetical protein